MLCSGRKLGIARGQMTGLAQLKVQQVIHESVKEITDMKNQKQIPELNPLLSVIVPCYNEEVMVGAFYSRTAPILAAIDEQYEIVFINDGSSDMTAVKILELHARDPRVKLINLSRNFGKEIAMTAGLDFSRGQAVVIMDADLQDSPDEIPELRRMILEDGYDLVSGWKKKRYDNTFFI